MRATRAAALVCAGFLAGAAACSRTIDAVAPIDCVSHPTDPQCTPTEWPIPGHSANSDPWLAQHHDAITVMKPQVLVLNFANVYSMATVMQTAQNQVDALAEGSSPHGSATPFLQYQIFKVVDLTDHPVPPGWSNPSSTLLPTTSTGDFDSTALFTSQFTDLYAVPDPSQPSRSLSLCEMFEKGIINEVWIAEGEGMGRRAPLNVERKQAYDDTGAPIAGMFLPCVGGGGCLDDILCGVTVKMAHLDPRAGTGCDLEVRGWGIDSMWDALPAVAADAHAFLNEDFDTRFHVKFTGWGDICDQGGHPCVTYPGPTSATGMYADGSTWSIMPLLQGCGSSQFPPNATFRGDFANPAPVDARCEDFGLGHGTNGSDVYAAYTADTVSGAAAQFPDCGGGWQIYWRQNMPGPGNHAHAPDGHPLKNWWPFLFY
jgi:hypothetical protein